MLTIFFDGQCPLCATEMEHLKRSDSRGLIHLVDLHDAHAMSHYPHIDFDKAMKVLHGEYQGNTLRGLEVTHRAWTLVGSGFWVAPLNWPGLKQVSHCIYLVVAKYRHPISSFLAKVFKLKTCSEGVCYDNRNNSHHRR